MNIMLGFTGFPGYFGMDEEESELTLGFWYMLQESLWEADFPDDETQTKVMDLAKQLYREVVSVLRRKVTWPAENGVWDAGNSILIHFHMNDIHFQSKQKSLECKNHSALLFNIFICYSYRRNVGDALINAYVRHTVSTLSTEVFLSCSCYVLREDFFHVLMPDWPQQMADARQRQSWEVRIISMRLL